MSWFKVDDHLHSHRKAMRAGTEAMGLWVLAGSWSGAEESDGWVPAYVLTRLVGGAGKRLAKRLVDAGLWDADTRDGEDGYQFRSWADYQPTRERLEAKRAEGRERMRRARSQGGDVRAHTERTADAVTPTRPDPTRPNKDTAAAAAESDPAFAAFWSAYPRKVGKADAERRWAKVLKSNDAETIMEGLRNACQVWQASGTDPKFIPHPATWLNQGRWADEVSLPDMPKARPATAAQCLRDDCPGTMHEWSDGSRTRYRCMGA